MLRTNEARDRLKEELGVTVTAQTIKLWVQAGKVEGAKFGGRYYVEWESVKGLFHRGHDSGR